MFDYMLSYSDVGPYIIRKLLESAFGKQWELV
jgi:hypothetical protein